MLRFVPPADAQSQVVIPDGGADLIVHRDVDPWNLISAGDHSWTLIDWDAARTGTRRCDLAYAAHCFVPLNADPATSTP